MNTEKSFKATEVLELFSYYLSQYWNFFYDVIGKNYSGVLRRFYGVGVRAGMTANLKKERRRLGTSVFVIK